MFYYKLYRENRSIRVQNNAKLFGYPPTYNFTLFSVINHVFFTFFASELTAPREREENAGTCRAFAACG